jgi:Trypsin-like peptidase domain
MRRGILAVLLAGAALAAPAGAQAAGTIQPGSYVESTVDGWICTLNFVFDGTGTRAGKTYIATAAHCVTEVGEPMKDFDGDVFGKVALIGNQDLNAFDYAFIQVDPEDVSRVEAGVAGSEQYPTGYTHPEETLEGDPVQISGWGLGYELTATTRERRQGLMARDNDRTWRIVGPMINGDSGGPLVHIPTGKALGIESRVCIGVCTDKGPSIEGVLAQARDRGFTVKLRTVS